MIKLRYYNLNFLIMFKPYLQNQMQLLPPSLEELIPKDHLARLISHSVDEMDLAMIEKNYSPHGQHAYHPAMLLKILVYGYAIGLRSSRKLADRLNEDLVFMWLSGRQTPDFRTIADFRKDKLTNFKTLFEQVLAACFELGLVRAGVISLDGTKILASASRNKMQYRKQLLRREVNLKKKVEEIVKEADSLDAAEDRLYGSETINRTGLAITKERVAQAIKKIQKKRQTLTRHHRIIKAKLSVIKEKRRTMRKDRNSFSSTDHEATAMMMKENYIAPGYNVQLATEHQVILGYGVYPDRNDMKLLKPMIEEVKARTSRRPEAVITDMGYGRKLNYRYLKQQKIDSFIPYQSYELDRSLKRRGLYRPPQEPDPELERYKTETRIKLEGAYGQAMLKRRRQDVEPTFGDIKRNMEFRRFGLRGRWKCELEIGLLSVAHNLKKMRSWVKRAADWGDSKPEVQELARRLGYLPA